MNAPLSGALESHQLSKLSTNHNWAFPGCTVHFNWLKVWKVVLQCSRKLKVRQINLPNSVNGLGLSKLQSFNSNYRQNWNIILIIWYIINDPITYKSLPAKCKPLLSNFRNWRVFPCNFYSSRAKWKTPSNLTILKK